MRLDSLKKFVSLRDALHKEKAELEARLAQINKALGASESLPAAAPAVGRAPKAAAKTKAPRAKGGRGLNAMSLPQAVLKVTAEKPLTKEEILKAVEKLGYKFSTKKPLASLNVVLYSKKKFKQVDGKFSPAN
jgi:hypothetical protein